MSNVNYSYERSNIADGDILMFSGINLISRLIKKITKSKYSHAGIAAWWGDRLMVLEANKHGVIATPLSHRLITYKGDIELWYVSEGAADRGGVVAAAKLELGKMYSVWGLVRNIRRILLKYSGAGDPARPPEKFFCSQYVAHCWRAGGIDLAKGISDDFTQPEDIVRSPYVSLAGVLKRY